MDGVGEQLGRTASRLGDLQTAMQQQVTTAERTSDDVEVIRKAAARLGKVRADRIGLGNGGAPGERRPLLDEVRDRGVLRIGAWTGFRGLNFIYPRRDAGRGWSSTSWRTSRSGSACARRSPTSRGSTCRSAFVAATSTCSSAR